MPRPHQDRVIAGRAGEDHSRMRARGRRLAPVLGVAALLTACYGLTGQQPTAAGPGVPRLVNARFEPDAVRAGDETVLVLVFEDSEGDVVEAVLVERVISDFRLVSATSILSRDIRRHRGEVVGTVREPFRWESPAIRFYDVYVVDLKGNASNRIPVRVTVR